MSADASGSDPERDAVAAALAALEAGVRQRHAERAAMGAGGDGLGIRLAELRQREFVQEPQPVSPRPGIGRLLVLARKAAYHLGFKWHARAVLAQQNEFNQAAAALVAELAERERELAAAVERLARRVERLEGRGARPGAPGAEG
jgi:hypothetical protein